MLRPNSDHAYQNLDEISPEDLNEWFTQICAEEPFRGHLQGGTLRTYPGTVTIKVAPLRVYFASGADRRHTDDGGARIYISTTESTITPGVLLFETRYYVYVSVSGGVASFSVETNAPDTARIYKNGDTSKRFLGTFLTDGSGNPRPFWSGPAQSDALHGYLQGGNVRSQGGTVYVDPFTLVMPANDERGQLLLVQRTVSNIIPTVAAGTRYYVYVTIVSGVIAVSTTGPDANKVFKSGDETQRYAGTFLTDDSGGIPAYTDAPVHSSVIAGRVFGGDIRSVGDDIHVAPFSASVLSAGVIEYAVTTTETVYTPTLAADRWRYLYLSIVGGVPAITDSSTAPDVALQFKTGDVTQLYLGCFRTEGTPHIRPFRKNGRVYTYLVSRANSQNDILAALTISGQDTSYTDVSLATMVPPTSRLARLRLRLTATGAATGAARVRTNGQSTAALETMVDNQVVNAASYFEGEVETDDSRVIEYQTDQTTNTTTAEIRVAQFVEAGDLNS